jgi:hypothetical protein
MTARQSLITLYLDYLNNYVTYVKYAEDHRLTEKQAHDLLSIGRECWTTNHLEA